MTDKQNRSTDISCSLKTTSSQPELDRAQLYDRASKLAVLTGYLGARDGYTQNQIIEMMIAELDSRGRVDGDKSTTLGLVEVGFALFQNKPGLTSEEVYEIANRPPSF